MVNTYFIEYKFYVLILQYFFDSNFDIIFLDYAFTSIIPLIFSGLYTELETCHFLYSSLNNLRMAGYFRKCYFLYATVYKLALLVHLQNIVRIIISIQSKALKFIVDILKTLTPSISLVRDFIMRRNANSLICMRPFIEYHSKQNVLWIGKKSIPLYKWLNKFLTLW